MKSLLSILILIFLIPVVLAQTVQAIPEIQFGNGILFYNNGMIIVPLYNTGQSGSASVDVRGENCTQIGNTQTYFVNAGQTINVSIPVNAGTPAHCDVDINNIGGRSYATGMEVNYVPTPECTGNFTINGTFVCPCVQGQFFGSCYNCTWGVNSTSGNCNPCLLGDKCPHPLASPLGGPFYPPIVIDAILFGITIFFVLIIIFVYKLWKTAKPTWKEFLKPSIWKIVIPIIFLIIFLLIEFYQIENTFVFSDFMPFWESFVFLPLFFGIVFLFGAFYYIGAIFAILLNLILWYFLSSIVAIQQNRKYKLIGIIGLILIIVVNGFINFLLLSSY